MVTWHEVLAEALAYETARCLGTRYPIKRVLRVAKEWARGFDTTATRELRHFRGLAYNLVRQQLGARG